MPIISSKNQVTLPVDVLRDTGLKAGDSVIIIPRAHGCIEVQTAEALIDAIAGSVEPSVYPPGYLEEMRSEWE